MSEFYCLTRILRHVSMHSKYLLQNSGYTFVVVVVPWCCLLYGCTLVLSVCVVVLWYWLLVQFYFGVVRRCGCTLVLSVGVVVLWYGLLVWLFFGAFCRYGCTMVLSVDVLVLLCCLLVWLHFGVVCRCACTFVLFVGVVVLCAVFVFMVNSWCCCDSAQPAVEPCTTFP